MSELSKDITPQELAIEQIKQLDSVEAIAAFTADDQRKGVQQAADERIATINEQAAAEKAPPSVLQKLLQEHDEVYETGSGFLFTNKNLAQMAQNEYKQRITRKGDKPKDLKTHKK